MSVEGIVIRRSIRVTFASVDVCVPNCFQEPNFSDETSHHVIVIIQLANPSTDDDDENHHDKSCSLQLKDIRGYLERILALGNRVRFQQGLFQTDIHPGSNRSRIRYIVPFYDTHNKSHRLIHRDRIQLIHCNFIDRDTCQHLFRRYYPLYHNLKNQQSRDPSLLTRLPSTRHTNPASLDKNSQWESSSTISSFHNNKPIPSAHGGGCKRERASIVVDWILQIILLAISEKRQEDPNLLATFKDPIQTKDPSSEIVADIIDPAWYHRLHHPEYSPSSSMIHHPHYHAVIQYLNSGTGVMDICGGSGHVSMALALRGIRSTVIDPREHVGKLPWKDKKIFRKAMKQQQQQQQQQPKDSFDQNNRPIMEPIQFSSLRAWFLSNPYSVDQPFRINVANSSSQEKYDDALVCSMCSEDNLLPHCSFIIGLHPDEATGDIVDFAVKHGIPFLIVPCCVFSRLFPTRWKPLLLSTSLQRKDSNDNDGDMDSSLERLEGLALPTEPPNREVVSTYKDLIEYLLDKNDSIRLSSLPFDGANLALWSYFDKIIL